MGLSIAERLVPLFPGRVTVAGRSLDKAKAAAAGIGHGAEGRAVDIFAADLADALDGVALALVCLDQTDTRFVEQCLSRGIHYVDISADYDFLSRVEKLDELAKRAEDAGVELVGITVDDHGDLSNLNEWERQKAVWNHRKWFDICRELGCSAFRANSGGWDDHLTESHVEQCIKSFRRLAEWGEETGVKVMMENHWGLSANPEWMVRVIEAVNSEWFGALPDFGNFPPEVQKSVLEQMEKRPKLVVSDTMNYYIEKNPEQVLEMVKLSDIALMNDAEARQLFKTSNLMKAADKILELDAGVNNMEMIS